MSKKKKFTENKKALAERKFAKKELGQNFLQSTEVRDRIMMAARDIKGKNVLEIGPGLGFLTGEIIKSEAKLTAVELDERAVKILKHDFGNKENFHLINDSILDLNLDEIFGNEPWQVVANIPYHITSPILRKLFSETKNKPTSAVLMVQKEVANKIARTRPEQTKTIESRSILSISVEIYAEATNYLLVPANCFEPAPRVDSAVLVLRKREQPLIPKDLEADFFTVVNAGFCERRKKLKNSLVKFFGEDVTPLLKGIDGERRAETLEISEWITMTDNFRNSHLKQ